MKVPLLDLKAQYATIREDVRTAVDSVFESQNFILGQNVLQLEELIAAYCGCRHAVGVASGTDALLLALKALGVGRGDVVITSSFTFFATAGAIANLEATPVFVDIEPSTYNMDPAKLGEFLEGRSVLSAHLSVANKLNDRLNVKVILPVHLFGQMAPMAEILEWAGRYRAAVVEDAAQAMGASQVRSEKDPPLHDTGGHDKRAAGTLGDIGALSFFPTKNLGAAGDAGMALTNSDQLGHLLRLLRVHGSQPKYVHPIVGYNSRLDELQAAVLVAKLQHLEEWSKARAQNADYYREAFKARGLGAACQTPVVLAGNRHIYHQFVVRAQRRDELRAFLAERGIGTEIYYPIPLHLQKCFERLGYRQGDLPETERAAREALALPVYPELTRNQMDYVIDSICAYYGQAVH